MGDVERVGDVAQPLAKTVNFARYSSLGSHIDDGRKDEEDADNLVNTIIKWVLLASNVRYKQYCG